MEIARFVFARGGFAHSCSIVFGYGIAALGLVPLSGQVAEAQQSWELRVCADPGNFPISDRDRPGFENRIAEILADELGAELGYEWTGADFAYAVETDLRQGKCDLVMGTGEGVMGLLNTVPYYRTPYVFVSREDSEFEVHSLDDPDLRGLRIATYAGTLPHGALVRRGLSENTLTHHSPVDRASAVSILQSVLQEDADIGIVYGPIAGYLARHEMTGLRIVPVTPELDPPLSPMYSVWTLGVRPMDVALRDRLNIALAGRWDEIQEVMDEYGVPLLPVPRPGTPGTPIDEVLRVGVVAPMPTGRSMNTDVVGWAASLGAMISEGWTDRDPEGPSLEVLLANAPSGGAAARAARRLVETEGVTALVGGIGAGQVSALSDVAEEKDVLFFNIGSLADTLRKEGSTPQMFHVEASASMYVDVLVHRFAEAGYHRWFVIHEDSDGGRRLYERTDRAISQSHPESQVIGRAEMHPGERVHQPIFDLLHEAAPEVVLLLLDAEDQEFFISQYESVGFRIPITGLPDPISQTREFYARFRQVAPQTGTGFRAALWETTLGGAAEEFNDRFTSRSGEPADPTGWAAYAAVKILFDAVATTESRDASTLIEYLESPEAVFDLGKGTGLSFRPTDHQLEQPLYLVKIDPEAEWGTQLSRRAAFAELVLGVTPIQFPDTLPEH